MKKLLSCLMVGLLWVPMLSAAPTVTEGFGEKVFYRYVNASGAKVMNHSLPAEAAQRGYEIVSLSGVVLKVVPPALSQEAAAQRAQTREQQQKLDEWDADLMRRYSSVAEIEAAKKRKLSDLEASMNLLSTNIHGVINQIRDQYSHGAAYERRNQPVPKEVYEGLANLQVELEETREKFLKREWEYEDIADKFERDKERFAQISGNK